MAAAVTSNANPHAALPGPRALGLALLALVLAAAALLPLFQFTDLDRRLADSMFDAAARRFPWREHWFAARFMHNGVKLGLIAIAVVLWGVLLLDAVRPLKRLAPPRRLHLRIVAACSVLVPLVVSLWKRYSALHCPWDLEPYGGSAPYLRLLDALPAGLAPGGCFPAGHTTGALWLAAFAVLWWPRRPGLAALVFTAGLGAGFGLGWVQQMRGAHFLSHTLWSVWASCAVIWAVLCIARAMSGGGTASVPQGVNVPGNTQSSAAVIVR